MFKERIKRIYLYRSILWDMSIREFRLSFAGLKLGIWWAFITPALLALSINFVFVEVLKMKVAHYTLFALSGILPWFFLSNSLQEMTNCLLGNLPILKQSMAPREFIPLSVIFANLVTFILGLLLFIPLFIFFNNQVLRVLFFLPLVIFLQSLFILGLGLLFAALNVFFRDLSRLLSIIFMLWFWVTPVFYSLDMLESEYSWVCMFNPATYFIILYRNILFEARNPSLPVIMAALTISLISLGIGFYFFVKKEPLLLKRI